MNRLSREQSLYLRSAAHQPVHWFPWGDEAFNTAREQQKPILLDIGAAWCHWCHVMDHESYENESIASIINTHYVAIKVDRDERPDIDARYQAAVGAITGQGGWPLTAFLLPDGRVFYGGTYFPPEDRYGRPGLARVLLALADVFKQDAAAVIENANQVEKFTREHLLRTQPAAEVSSELVQSALTAISREQDLRYGGFGGAPKFPHASTIEFLLQQYYATKETWMLEAVERTLRAMAKGGIYDQLGGGFHRYSVDERWIVPHFEKMLHDNASLLVNYVHAYQATGDPFYRLVALDIVRFTNDVLADTPHGAFYGSQDADVAPGDDGSYFTWTLEDARSVLSDDEFAVAQLRYNIYEQGEMHHDPRQNVLFIDKSPDDIAQILQRPLNDVMLTLEQAKGKLRAARATRKPPAVDTTIYASWNGTMIAAYFEAYKAFGEEMLLQFALRSLSRILQEHTHASGLITHRASSPGADAFLDDQVEIARAALGAFEVTGEPQYLEAAKRIAQKLIDEFWDTADGGAFTDVPRSHQPLGALAMKHKPILDSPTAGANAVAALLLLQLESYTGESVYREYVQQILQYFAGSVKGQGTFAATYFMALHAYLNPPVHIVVTGPRNDATTTRLFRKSLETFSPLKTVALISGDAAQILPAALSSLQGYVEKPAAFICSGFVCSPPVFSADEIESSVLAIRHEHP